VCLLAFVCSESKSPVQPIPVLAHPSHRYSALPLSRQLSGFLHLRLRTTFFERKLLDACQRIFLELRHYGGRWVLRGWERGTFPGEAPVTEMRGTFDPSEIDKSSVYSLRNVQAHGVGDCAWRSGRRDCVTSGWRLHTTCSDISEHLWGYMSTEALCEVSSICECFGTLQIVHLQMDNPFCIHSLPPIWAQPNSDIGIRHC
jgi:hypothetical protein